MSRGEKESICLERVKSVLFYNESKPVCNPFDCHSYLDVDDATFERDYIFYCNPDFGKKCFGLLEAERVEFANIIRTAKPNPASSKFPDFIFDNGFIEHFQITSSKVNRKGATHAKKESEFQRRVETEIEKLEGEWGKSPSFGRVHSESWEFQNPAHSHEYLMNSFKQNWESHINSSKRFSGEKSIGIFMVEHPEISLAMCENVYSSWINGMSQGDMREQEKFKDYRLSRDKELLNYMHAFRDEIKYVIFVNPQRVEVIRTENIPYLLQLMPWDYAIYPMHVCTKTSAHNISIPNSLERGDESDD